MDDRTADRLDIAETLYRYAEAIDLIGAHPVADGEEDPVLPRAIEILRTCLTEDGIDACCFTAFDGPDAADVKSYINTQHWMADGRHLDAPIEYHDRVVRGDDGVWRIKAREISVWRWWVTEGWAPQPTDPTLARPVG